MIEPASGALTGAALGAVIEGLISRLKPKLPRSLRQRLRRWEIRNIPEHLLTLHEVKPLWRTSRSVSFEKLYHPLSVLVENESVCIWSVDDLDTSSSIVIRGSAGQGKSMLMRHLAKTEFHKQTRFPIFLELRQFESRLENNSIEANCIRQFDALGLSLTPEDFYLLARTGELILFLDGYDEANENRRRQLLREIDHLAEKTSPMQIIISTRPGMEIEPSIHFRILDIAELSDADVLQYASRVISCMAPEGDIKTQAPETLARQALSQISGAEIQELIRVPLMLDLFLMQILFKKKTVPVSKIDLFTDIFDLAFISHDRSKGLIRERRSPLNALDLKRFMCRLAFLTFFDPHLRWSTMKMLEHAENTAKQLSMNTNPQHALDDIEALTGLLIRHDGDYEFAHRELRDFHAAITVHEASSDDKETLYSMLRSDQTVSSAWPILSFLRKMEPTMFRRFFEIPFWSLYITQLEALGVSEEDAGFSIFGGDLIFIQIQNGQKAHIVRNGVSAATYYYNLLIEDNSDGGLKLGAQGELAHLFSAERIIAHWDKINSFINHETTAMTRLVELFKISAVSTELANHLSNMVLVIRVRLEELRRKDQNTLK